MDLSLLYCFLIPQALHGAFPPLFDQFRVAKSQNILLKM